MSHRGSHSPGACGLGRASRLGMGSVGRGAYGPHAGVGAQRPRAYTHSRSSTGKQLNPWACPRRCVCRRHYRGRAFRKACRVHSLALALAPTHARRTGGRLLLPEQPIHGAHGVLPTRLPPRTDASSAPPCLPCPPCRRHATRAARGPASAASPLSLLLRAPVGGWAPRAGCPRSAAWRFATS